MVEDIALLWSGGKDSALALWELTRAGAQRVRVLVTTVTEEYDRISMHGVRRPLLEAQARSLGLSLLPVFIPARCTNDQYEKRMARTCEALLRMGLRTIASGDIFLEDVRHYREERLKAAGMQPLFPLWGRDSLELARTFITAGFKAVTTCVDGQALGEQWAGREFDGEFLADLPESRDPCGENGEFHTFVYAGPPFAQPIDWIRGETVLRDNRFYYCDLVPA